MSSIFLKIYMAAVYSMYILTEADETLVSSFITIFYRLVIAFDEFSFNKTEHLRTTLLLLLYSKKTRIKAASFKTYYSLLDPF